MKNAYNRKRVLFYGINIVLPLLIGGIVYVVFRRDTYLAEFVFEIIGLKQKEIILPAWLSFIVRNYISDFLWAYSLAFALSSLFQYKRRNAVIVFVICVVFALTIELLQNTRAFSGTFDVVDIALEAISVLLALLIIKYYEERQHETVNQNH